MTRFKKEITDDVHSHLQGKETSHTLSYSIFFVVVNPYQDIFFHRLFFFLKRESGKKAEGQGGRGERETEREGGREGKRNTWIGCLPNTPPHTHGGWD